MRSPHLLFEWPARHRIHILLPAMVLAAGLAHTAVFFLFSAKQPPPGEGGPNPAKVYFLGPGSAAAVQLAPLLDSMDPALQAPGRGLAREIPVEVSYSPGYLENTFEFDPPPPSAPMQADSRVFEGPVEIRQGRPANSGSVTPVPTRLKFSSSLAARVPADVSAGPFQTHSSGTPPPASFLIALSPEGSPRHVLMDRSSGDDELDLAAIRHLRSLSFLPADDGKTVWGFVEFQWGGDLKNLPPAP
jgi:outer membrane biosynthesis protein TonB